MKRKSKESLYVSKILDGMVPDLSENFYSKSGMESPEDWLMSMGVLPDNKKNDLIVNLLANCEYIINVEFVPYESHRHIDFTLYVNFIPWWLNNRKIKKALQTLNATMECILPKWTHNVKIIKSKKYGETTS